MWNVYRKLKSNGFVPLGTNTDSVIVDGNYESLHKNFQFSREFGRYKFEREKKLRNKPILLTIKDIIDFKIMSVNTIYIESEKDFDLNIPESILKYNREVISILNDHKVLFIGSGLPGSGKSVAAALGCNKDEILFCTSYNMLVDVLMMDGNDAITNNKLLNLRINDDVTCAQNKVHFDVSPYKRIVFDEVLLCDPEMLSRLYRFMLRFPDKQIIATGDIDQLDCINFNFNNVSDQSEYMKKCIEFLFPNRIILKVIKRLETEEDRKNVENLKIDLFNENNNLMDVINKYDFNTVDNMDNVQTDTNITYFRSKALEINQLKQNKMIIPENYIEYTYTNDNNTRKYKLKYYKDLIIICRQHHQCKAGRLYVNVKYKITDINNETIILEGITRKTGKMPFDISILKKVSLPYCFTCHSVQGTTIKDKFTIFHCNTPYVSRKYIWTAITRANKLSNITIFKHSNKEVEAIEESKMKQYVKLKIENYKHQDLLAKRSYIKYPFFHEEHYVDYNWFVEQPDKCHYCGENFYYNLINGTVESNTSVDRIDNTEAHVINNCLLSCIHCNVSKKIKYYLLYMSMDKIKEAYYNPSTGLISANKLYHKLKDEGITLKQVQDFLKNQEATQLYKPITKQKAFFPITSYDPYEHLQIDLLDFSNIATTNSYYKYLLVSIDIFTRKVFVVPLKFKNTEYVIDGMKKVSSNQK